MMMNTILSVCFIFVWLILYLMLMNNIKPKKNIILGVTLPHYAHDDPAVKVICKSFKKWLNIIMLPLLLLMIPPFFMPLMGQAMLWFMSWVLLAIVAPMLVFARHRGKLMALKRVNNWYSEAAGRALVDIKVAAIPQKKINGLLFLPPVIAALIPIIHSLINTADWGFTLTLATFLLMNIIFWLCYHLIFRLRAEIVNEDVSLTFALTRVRRYNWGKLFLIASWLTGALAIFMWIMPDNTTAILVGSFAYCLLIIALSIQTEFAVRVAQQKLTAADTGSHYLDEDEYWLLGLIYHNPNDNHLLVNDRVGMNMSLNLAKPAGKFLFGLTVLIIIALPFTGVMLWNEEITPTRLIVSETTLIARHTRDKFVMPLNSIEKLELIETLPSMIRVAGTGFENLYKGNFRAGDYGTSRVCLNPRNPPFLVIKSGGHTYIINDADSNVTRRIYDLISRY
jgi:uncharacterized membrane protein